MTKQSKNKNNKNHTKTISKTKRSKRTDEVLHLADASYTILYYIEYCLFILQMFQHIDVSDIMCVSVFI